MAPLDAAHFIIATTAAKSATCAAASSWPWIPIVTGALALIGAIGGTWTNAHFTRKRESEAREDARRAEFLYLAVTISAILDGFISRCAAVVSDDGTRQGQRDYSDNPQGDLVVQVPAPKLDLGDLDVVWKSMPVDLLDQVHSLPVRLANAEAYLDFAAEFDSSSDGSDYFADRRLRYAKIGIITGQVLAALRERAGLRPQIDESDTTIPFLQKQLEELEARAEQHAQSQREWAEELTAKVAATQAAP